MDRVLVLNSDFTPINVTTSIKGYILVSKGKAEILKSSDIPINCGDHQLIRPLVIRLLYYVKFRVRALKINRQRIFKRDNHECVYCGSVKQLTLDHVIPKSRGGKNTWNNLVTCCFTCNLKKGNKTPDEAKMVMRTQPHTLNILTENSFLNKLWEEYQKSFIY